MSQGLQIKQQYLRVNIIQAGYSPDQFVQFCSKTHDIDDLQNWSIQQLKDIVQAFIKKQVTNKVQIQQIKEKQIKKQQVQIKPSLTFSDQDWNMFLNTPIITPVKEQPKQTIIFMKQINTNKTDSYKQSPLSPPSAGNNNYQIQQKQKQKNQTQQNKFQKIQKIKISSNNQPINLSNIKISTAKQKIQPNLPVINDIVVLKTEQVSRNFLQGDVTVYHISFQPCNIIIQRKFSQLRRARVILSKLYPFLRLPYLQPQGWVSSSEGKDPQMLIKYKWMVQQFFKYLLLKSDELKNNQFVRVLCGMGSSQKKDIKKYLDFFQNTVHKPKFLGQVVLCQNQLIIPPTRGCDRLIANTNNFAYQLQLQYDKLKKQLQNLFSTFDLVIKSYNQIGNTFQNMENITKKYNAQNNQPKQIRIFDGFKDIMTMISSQINQKLITFRGKIKNLFRYQKDNMTTLKQIIQTRSKIHVQYQKQNCPSFSSNSMKIKGVNVEIEATIPIQQPVKNNKNLLAVQQIFWSWSISRQINRYWQHLRRKVNEIITLIAYDELDNQNQNLNFWNTMIKRCVV